MRFLAYVRISASGLGSSVMEDGALRSNGSVEAPRVGAGGTIAMSSSNSCGGREDVSTGGRAFVPILTYI